MKTNDIFSKFQSSNNKLEVVLYRKKLSGDVKNLLLSMLYNITSAYNSYANVKVNVESKNKFVDNIISIVDKCNSIEIIKPSSEEGEKFIEAGISSKVDTYFKDIKVFPSDKAMLYALYKMNDTQMYLDEKYHLLRIALPEMLNEGRDINNIEIIRDFNSWSWNTIPSEISNIECNLIYQNLLILLGYDFLENWMKQEKQSEILEKLEKELKKKYYEQDVDELLELIYKLSIQVCVKRNKNEKKRLIEEKEWSEKELERLKDRPKLVEELTKIKKEKAKEIKKIDEMINNENLLKKEFEERNKHLSEYKKIFSVENLLGTIKKERKKALSEIEKANEILDAKNYVKMTHELEKNIKMLKDIKTTRNIEKYKINIQKIFMKCLEKRINELEILEQKGQGIALLCILRYYNFVAFDNDRLIKDVEPLKDELDNLNGKILAKLFETKIANPITKDIETDIGIVKPIFETRIMNLSNINIIVKELKQEGRLEISIYDGNTLELEFTLQNLNKVEIKNKKKVKLFSK